MNAPPRFPPKRIAVDFDGTLADTMSLICRLVNFREGTDFKPEEIDTWTFFQDRGHDKAFWACYDLMDETHLRRAIRPTSPFACPTVKWLMQRGHEVEVVTANHGKAAEDMVTWLFGHGLDCPVRPLGRVSVAEKAKLDYHLFIDDAPKLADEVNRRAVQEDSNQRMLLVDRPYNALTSAEYLFSHDTDWTGRARRPVVRMKDWRDAPSILERMGL